MHPDDPYPKHEHERPTYPLVSIYRAGRNGMALVTRGEGCTVENLVNGDPKMFNPSSTYVAVTDDGRDNEPQVSLLIKIDLLGLGDDELDQGEVEQRLASLELNLDVP